MEFPEQGEEHVSGGHSTHTPLLKKSLIQVSSCQAVLAALIKTFILVDRVGTNIVIIAGNKRIFDNISCSGVNKSIFKWIRQY